jgi:hypothetical protein
VRVVDMSTKSVVVGSQVSLGVGASVKPYPMHSKENSSSRSFLFKRHVYSHTERMGLSGLFGGDTLQFLLKYVEACKGACCCFRDGGEVEGRELLGSSSFSVTSNDDEATDENVRAP